MRGLIPNMTDVDFEDVLLGEGSEGAALDLFSIVNFLFNSFVQEVEADVMGVVHPDRLIYSS